MINIDKVNVMNFENAIRGARNPMNSWNRMDSYYDENGNFVSAADVWNEKKLEELFNRLNPNRALRLARTKKQAENNKS